MASKSVEQFYLSNVTDDRQTDHATEKCVGIGGIACAARAIPANITYCAGIGLYMYKQIRV